MTAVLLLFIELINDDADDDDDDDESYLVCFTFFTTHCKCKVNASIPLPRLDNNYTDR